MKSNSRAIEIAAFYACYADRLRRIVTANVKASEDVIEDAFQTAWAVLLRREDVSLDVRGMRWLTNVAIHEGWRLASTAREVPIGAFQGLSDDSGDDDVAEPADTLTPGTDEQGIARVEDATRIAYLRRLKPRERQALALKALGYSYEEICDLTNASYTAVNRRLAEGRARLRQIASYRADTSEQSEAD